jgi:Ca2+-binding RTX toxin-like protein
MTAKKKTEATLPEAAGIASAVDPADRKFFTDNYLGQQGNDSLPGVHSADRKFFFNGDLYPVGH